MFAIGMWAWLLGSAGAVAPGAPPAETPPADDESAATQPGEGGDPDPDDADASASGTEDAPVASEATPPPASSGAQRLVLPRPPPDGRIVRLAVEMPGQIPEPVQAEIVEAIDTALREAGLTVVASATACGEPSCQQRVLAEAGASLGMQVLVASTGSDYQLTTTFFGPDGVVASEGESCDICRHDEVVARTGALIGRVAADFSPPAQAEPAAISIVSSPPGAQVFIDGQSVGTTPYEGSLDRGVHTVRVERSGYQPMERSVDIAESARHDEAFELQRAGSTLRMSPRTEMTVGWAAIGVGVAALATGIALLVIDENEIKSDCSGPNVDANGVCKYRYNTVAGGAVGVATGVFAAGAGVGLLLHGRKRAGKASKPEVAVGLGRVRGRF